MSLIEAKCPNCGAPLKIDTDKDASYCEFCKTPFITSSAMHVSGDYVQGDKIINNVKQDNEHTVENSRITLVGIMFVIIMAVAVYILFINP